MSLLEGTPIRMSQTREIALIGILAAVNIASRIIMQSLPNVKPVTSIIIVSVLLFGLRFGVGLTVVTTVVSNLFLGMGVWTLFQILAWVVICVLTDLLAEMFRKMHKDPPLVFMACFALMMGYVFGFVVSLDHLLMGGWGYFLPYYISGLLFDTFHAAGNFFFYLICAPVLMRVMKREIERNIRTEKNHTV